MSVRVLALQLQNGAIQPGDDRVPDADAAVLRPQFVGGTGEQFADQGGVFR